MRLSPMAQTILISVSSALLVSIIGGIIGGYVTIFVEKKKLKIELDKAYSVEFFRKRLEAYAVVWKTFGALSRKAVEPLDPPKAVLVARELNDWLYAAGGLIADQATRGALLEVRNACLTFEGKGVSENLEHLRDKAMQRLREDLTLEGLESFDTGVGES